MAYRKRRERDTWHWRYDCSNYPKVNYEQSASKPKSGELCNECRAKDRAEKRDKK